jgi:hypothetical protein
MITLQYELRIESVQTNDIAGVILHRFGQPITLTSRIRLVAMVYVPIL